MRKALNVLKLGWQPNEGRLTNVSYVPSRGARYQANIKWVMPERKKFHDPARSGDLVGMPSLNPNSIYLPFKNSKELATANDKVKKIFSLDYQNKQCTIEAYQQELVEKVKNHMYDTDSKEVQIAKLTGLIRFYQPIALERPTKYKRLICFLKHRITERNSLLTALRNEDYKKFEWLLEKLDLEYRPPVAKEHSFLTRKKSLELLAKLQVEQIKEERLALLKKEFDEQKVPFLEKKILKLREIKEIEEKNNLPITVTDEDVEECVKKLEEVKVQVAERAKKGYKRKIHPYFLEAYNETLLLEMEKSGEIIREKEFSRQDG